MDVNENQSVWTTGFGLMLTDCRTAGFRASGFEQTVRIRVSVAGSALRLRFAGRYTDLRGALDSIRVGVGDRTDAAAVVVRIPEVQPSADGCFVTSGLPISVRAGDVLNIRIVWRPDVPVADVALFPDTALMTIETTGSLSCTGDRTRRTALEDIPDDLHWLAGFCGVDIRTTKRVQTVTFFGDSLVQLPYWIDPFMEACCRRQPECLTFRNAGISGNRLLSDTMRFDPDIGQLHGLAGLERAAADLFAGSGSDVVWILIGINDLILPVEYGRFGEAASAEQLIGGFKQLIDICQAADAVPILCTLLPFWGSKAWNGFSERARQQINAWIRNNPAVQCADLDRMVRDPSDERRMKAGWAAPDGLHLSPAGGQMLAESLIRDGWASVLCNRSADHCDR